ncbi:restriction endonuclease [Akkermansia sp.]|uniref:restriction endonuclease n=1 Tax=Akkermansia sp. TaxID=1872421 RepID=UPI0025BF41B2|nr:restriction endonuclease [Akkermansia sp.]
MEIIYHYPPELNSLVIEVIPKLCRSKQDLLTFFRGAGVPYKFLEIHQNQLIREKDSFNKYHVTRDVIEMLNKAGETCLRERREILKRITEFDDFSVCWENDQQAAYGLVARIRDLINRKDSFTRMNIERQREREARLCEEKRKSEAEKKKADALQKIQQNFATLFLEKNPWKRGKELEGVLNSFFEYNDILLSEAITIKGDDQQGIIEQIDGVIEYKGKIYLVEAKWESETLGREKIASHLVRGYNRGGCEGGIFISYSAYSPAAIADCKNALGTKVFVLFSLEEIFKCIQKDGNFIPILDEKINRAIIYKQPI